MTRIKPVALIITSLLAWLALTAWPALADEPITARLPNGVGLVVQRLDRAPAVAVQVWVRAGSTLETPPERGITHQIEHMIFKGTPSRGLGQVAGQIEAAGGRINAYTSFDHTVYHTLLPADSWRLGLEVLADAVQHSLFDADELAKEKQVVLEEWRRGQDNPQRRLAERMFSLAFEKSPYRHPIIGYKDTIEGFTRQAILKYIKEWYTGDRMTVVVVGQVDPQKVMAEAKKLFADVPQGAPDRPSPAIEPPQKKLRFAALNGRVKQAYMSLAFRIPGLKSAHTPAYDLLSQLLGGAKSSPLIESLWAQKGLVTSIRASSFTPLGEGLFWVSMSLPPANLDAAVREVWRLLGRAARVDFTTEEMARAKLAFEADYVREKETVNGQASKLGFYANMMGGLDQERIYLDRVQRLTPEAIRQAAAEAFRAGSLSAVLMLPEGQKLPDRAWLARLTPEQPAAAHRAKADQEKVKVMSLPGGAKLLVMEDHSLPLVAVNAVFSGGLLQEPADQAGIFQLMASTWTRGSIDLPASELDRQVEDMAGGLSAFSGRNTCGLTANFLSRFADEGLDLFCRVLLTPSFPAEEVAKRKADQLAAIKRRDERPEAIAFDLFRRAVYDGYPYSRDPLGSPKTLAPIGPADLAKLHDRIVRSDNLVLAVVGDVKAADIQQRLTVLLSELQPGFKPLEATKPAPLPADGLTETAARPKLAQVQTLFGFRSPGMADPDSVALDVLARALAGQSGRLFIQLRDKKSLAYSLTAMNRAGVGIGAFVFYVASAPDKLATVKSELKAQLQAVLDKPLTKAEFTKARAGLLADWVLDSQSLDSRASRLAIYERLGLGHDYETRYVKLLRELTPDKVRQAARKWLHPNQPIWVILEPED